MANSAGICNSFKVELMLGQHQFGTATIVSRGSLTAPTTDTFKAALFLASGSLSPSTTTTYSTTSEVPNSGTYAAGGATVTNATAPSLSSNTAVWTPSAQLQWTSFTGTAFDTLLLYNSTQSNRAVALYNFGSQTVTAGTFTLTMPANTAGNALINLA